MTATIDTPAPTATPVAEPRSAVRARTAAEGFRSRLAQLDRRVAALDGQRRTARMDAVQGSARAREQLASLDAQLDRLAGERDLDEAQAVAAERRYEAAMAGPDAEREAQLRALDQQAAEGTAAIEAALDAVRGAVGAYVGVARARHRLAVSLGDVPASEAVPAVGLLQVRLQEFAAGEAAAIGAQWPR